MKKSMIIILVLIIIVCQVKAQNSTAQLIDLIPPNCLYRSGENITLTTTGGTTGIGETTQYALIDPKGNILEISTTPSFNNLIVGSYFVYAVSYETAKGVSQFNIGNLIQSVTSMGCIDFSAPYAFNVCPKETDCDYYLGDDVTINSIGGNTVGSTVNYILTDENGLILQVNSTPTFTNLQTIGTHFVYALVYENSLTVSNLSTGNQITTVTINGSCYDWSASHIFEVCFTANPNVFFSKTAIDTIQAGATIFYTFTITNNAGTILNNLTFSDTLSNSLAFLSEPIGMTNGLVVLGSAIHKSIANLILNDVPMGVSSFQLMVLIPVTVIGGSHFCNQSYLSGLTMNNLLLSNVIPSDDTNTSIVNDATCTVIWQREICDNGIDDDLDGLIDCDDTGCIPLPTINQITHN